MLSQVSHRATIYGVHTEAVVQHDTCPTDINKKATFIVVEKDVRATHFAGDKAENSARATLRPKSGSTAVKNTCFAGINVQIGVDQQRDLD